MQISPIEQEAQFLLHQLHRRQEQSTNWFSRAITLISCLFSSDSAPKQLSGTAHQHEPSGRDSLQKSIPLAQKIAKTCFELLQNHPDGLISAKNLLSQAVQTDYLHEREFHHWQLMQEASLLLQEDRTLEAKELISSLKEASNSAQCASIVADQVRKRVFQRMELIEEAPDLESNVESNVERIMGMANRCFEKLDPSIDKPRKRVRLYRYLLERDRLIPKLHSEKGPMHARRRFLLRMTKSDTQFAKEFSGIKPGEGFAMLMEDLEDYLKVHPNCPKAKLAKIRLLHSRSLTIQADSCERLNRNEKTTAYLEIYYEDLQREIRSLTEEDELLLLGGPSDHAMLHTISQTGSQAGTMLKTFNSGLGMEHHLELGKERYQTHIISSLTKERFTSDLLQQLFSYKLIDCSHLREPQLARLSKKQMQAIYKTLRSLATKPAKALRSEDPTHWHKRRGQNDCLRSVYLLWLKEGLFKENYGKFKEAFSEAALGQIKDPTLLALGEKKLAHRKKKAKSL